MDEVFHAYTKHLRFFGALTTQTVQEAAKVHNLSVTTSVLMGRLISGAVLMAQELKNEQDMLTLRTNSDGPVNQTVVTVNAQNHVKCWLTNPQSELPLKDLTKAIDVPGALGNGTLTVLKDVNGKRPYQGTVELTSGEIGQDIAYYYGKSMQIPTAVAVGVFMNPDGTVRHAGGYMVQLLPDTPEEVEDQLKQALSRMPNLSDLLDMGWSMQKIGCETLLKDFDCTIAPAKKVGYYCNCNRQRFATGLQMLNKSELQDMIDEGNDIDVHCHFCNSHYSFTPAELQQLLTERENQ